MIWYYLIHLEIKNKWFNFQHYKQSSFFHGPLQINSYSFHFLYVSLHPVIRTTLDSQQLSLLLLSLFDWISLQICDLMECKIKNTGDEGAQHKNPKCQTGGTKSNASVWILTVHSYWYRFVKTLCSLVSSEALSFVLWLSLILQVCVFVCVFHDISQDSLKVAPQTGGLGGHWESIMRFRVQWSLMHSSDFYRLIEVCFVHTTQRFESRAGLYISIQ